MLPRRLYHSYAVSVVPKLASSPLFALRVLSVHLVSEFCPLWLFCGELVQLCEVVGCPATHQNLVLVHADRVKVFLPHERVFVCSILVSFVSALCLSFYLCLTVESLC